MASRHGRASLAIRFASTGIGSRASSLDRAKTECHTAANAGRGRAGDSLS